MHHSKVQLHEGLYTEATECVLCCKGSLGKVWSHSQGYREGDLRVPHIGRLQPLQVAELSICSVWVSSIGNLDDHAEECLTQHPSPVSRNHRGLSITAQQCTLYREYTQAQHVQPHIKPLHRLQIDI